MNQNKVTFSDILEKNIFLEKKLNIDYLAFKLQDVKENKIPIIQEKFQQKFHYTLYPVYKERDLEKDSFRQKNVDKIYWRKVWKPTWKGIILHFPGKIADQLYTYIKNNGIPWRTFNIPKEKVTLSRIDICYVKPISQWTTQSKEKLEEFYERSRKLPINKSVDIKHHANGARELRICRRDSPSFFRVYSFDNGLKFELEMKKKYWMEVLQPLLFQKKTFHFENKMVDSFEKQCYRRLVLDTPFTSWLVKIYRVKRKKQRTTKVLLTTYFTSSRSKFREAYDYAQKSGIVKSEEPWLFSDDEALYSLIQLSSFIKIEIKETKSYYESFQYKSFQFSLIKFFRFIELEKISQAKRKKYATFFKVLPLVCTILKEFDDDSFLLQVGIPATSIYKVSNQWMVKMDIANSLLDYYYPFSHSSYFLNWKNKHDLRVKIRIIQSFNTYSIKKVIPISKFLDHYKSQSGKIKNLVKLFIIASLKELVRNNDIFSQLQLEDHTFKTYTIHTHELTPRSFTRIKNIFFYEKINSMKR
jgi:hypothetical protein